MPVGYEVYAGNTFEGHTPGNALQELHSRYGIEHVIFVADSALLSNDDLNLLEERNQGYIVGARSSSSGEDFG